MTFYGNKMAVAQFAKDLLLHSELNSALITITIRGTSEDCSVHIAIDTSLEDTVSALAQIYSTALISTSPRNTQAG